MKFTEGVPQLSYEDFYVNVAPHLANEKVAAIAAGLANAKLREAFAERRCSRCEHFYEHRGIKGELIFERKCKLFDFNFEDQHEHPKGINSDRHYCAAFSAKEAAERKSE